MSWLIVALPLLALLGWLAVRTRPSPDERPQWDRTAAPLPAEAPAPAASPSDAPESEDRARAAGAEADERPASTEALDPEAVSSDGSGATVPSSDRPADQTPPKSSKKRKKGR